MLTPPVNAATFVVIRLNVRVRGANNSVTEIFETMRHVLVVGHLVFLRALNGGFIALSDRPLYFAGQDNISPNWP